MDLHDEDVCRAYGFSRRFIQRELISSGRFKMVSISLALKHYVRGLLDTIHQLIEIEFSYEEKEYKHQVSVIDLASVAHATKAKVVIDRIEVADSWPRSTALIFLVASLSEADSFEPACKLLNDKGAVANRIEDSISNSPFGY